MACGDVLSLEDLQTAKKHQIFEAEVITGKVGGVAGGATIGTATNPVTGQTQQTLPSILADLGFDVQSWTSSTGGVLASANQVFLNDTPGSLGLGDYYAWGGTFPKTVPAGTDPALVGSGYIMRSSRFAGTQAREALRRSYAEAGYNLVDGSFEAGGTLVNTNDVLLQERTGKAFSGPAGVVAAGTNPASGGFIDVSANVFVGVSPRAYGCGNGGDDTAAFQAFVNNHDEWVGDPDLVINVSSSVVIPYKQKLSANMNGTTIVTSGGFVPLRNQDLILYTGTVVGPVLRSTKTITMDSPATASNFAKGNLVQLRSQNLWYFDNRGILKKGETHLVSSVSGSVVTVEADIFDTYEATETLTLVKIQSSEYNVKGLKLKGPAGVNNNVNFYGLTKSNLDISVDGSYDLGLLLKNCYATNYTGDYRNCTNPSIGYGVQVSQCTFTNNINSTFWNNRRAVDVSGSDAVSRMCSVFKSKNFGVSDSLYSVSSGFGSHGPSDGTRFFGCEVLSCRQAFVTRGVNETVSECFGYGRMADFIASTDGAGLTVMNNRYSSASSPSAPADGDSRVLNFANITMHDRRGRTTITNNVADRIVNSWATLTPEDGCNPNEQGELICTNNSSVISTNSAGASFTAIKYQPIAGYPTLSMKRCIIKNNSHVMRFGGAVINYDPLLIFDITNAADSGNILDGLLLQLTDENGNTTGLAQRVFADIREDSIHVYGRLAFSTASPGSVKLSGFPAQRQGQSIGFSHIDYGIGAVSVAYNGTVGNLGKWFISSDLTNPTGNLLAGTHSISLDMTYENSVSRFF